jgi:hypothetical protein
MSRKRKPSAIEKRANNPDALAPFALCNLKQRLPLAFPRHPDLPPSPKPRYRSHYRYQGFDDLGKKGALKDLSPFEIDLRLFDYTNLEPLLATHIYRPSAKGQVPFHPVSMYLLSLFRRERNLSRRETLRILRHRKDGRELRRLLGFKRWDCPSESGLRHFEGQITPALQQEINSLQIEALYQAGFFPTQPDAEAKVTLSFDGMLHQARSRMRCASPRQSCYQPAPRPCPAKERGKEGCDCADLGCAQICRHATPRDPEARLIAYSGKNKRAKTSPNTPCQGQQRSSGGRFVYGYYSYAGQILDDALSTYWVLPASFGPANWSDPVLFPDNFTYLQSRFPWLHIEEVITDAAACEQTCLDLIWDAGALRLVDISAHKSDQDPDICLARGYDKNGHPLCPFGYTLRANGHDYERRRTKWRCAKQCRLDPQRPECDYQASKYKHGYTVTVGRTHADGTVRLAREIPYGSPAWKERYNRRNAAESRNSVLERLGLKRLPVHGLPLGYVIVMQGDFVANQRTLVRLIREAATLGLS